MGSLPSDFPRASSGEDCQLTIPDSHPYSSFSSILLSYRSNASWTLKCDLNCHYVIRLLNHLAENGYTVCTPRFDPDKLDSEPLLDFDAGYIKRALDILPRQGSKPPWKVYQNYLRDTVSLKYGGLEDEYLEYR